jgi:hypothetical protein
MVGWYIETTVHDEKNRANVKRAGEKPSRVRDALAFELWTSLFADDCALLFNSREDLTRGFNHIFSHLRKFGLLMPVGRGDTTSKTEAMYFPSPR